jgi:hypothetical protein
VDAAMDRLGEVFDVGRAVRRFVPLHPQVAGVDDGQRDSLVGA